VGSGAETVWALTATPRERAVRRAMAEDLNMTGSIERTGGDLRDEGPAEGAKTLAAPF
jgi:hypothetical protein